MSDPESEPQPMKTGGAARRDSVLDIFCHVDPFYQRKLLRSEACAKIDVDVGNSDTERESRLLVLYAGGTIGMRNIDGAYRPAANYLLNQVRQMPMFNDTDYVIRIRQNDEEIDSDRHPLAMPLSNEGRRVIYTIWEYDPLLDSSNMTMTDWARLALDIQKNYHDFDGFVILHGTDTMAYTASALSFMLENLGKPVIITGSQIPIFEVRSDGRENFLGALILAGHYCIPEVTIYFNNKLLRGNRATKVDAGAFDAFHTPNLSPLAELEIDIHVNWDAVFRPTRLAAFKVHTNLCPNVGLLRLFPSITLATVKAFLQPPMEGVILQTYGAGNGPDSREDLLKVLKEAAIRGVIIINITQCSRGYVSPSYATGKALLDIGIIPGLDLTPEAALTKLSYVLGKTECSLETKREMMAANLCGEMRVVTSNHRRGEMHSFDSAVHDSLLEFPLLQNLKDTMRLSSEQLLKTIPVTENIHLHFVLLSNAEVSMLKSAIFPALLCAAAREDNEDALKKLQGAGAQFSQSDYDGRTALHVACSEGKTNIVRFLLGNGALVHQRDRYGHTPLDDAVRFNHHDVISVLRQVGAHLNVPPFKLGTMLCNAAAHRELLQLKTWHLAGANINQGDYDNRTALHVACCQGSFDLIELLLKMGSQVDIRDAFGLSPCDEAEKRGFHDILKLMRTAPAAVNVELEP